VRIGDGSLVFIPGGSSGIGLATACRLAARGADVAIFARRRAPLEEAAARIAAAALRPTQRVEWRQCDVGDAAQVAAEVGGAVAALGTPDLLINCAGRAIPDYFERISTAQLEETLRINLYGAWHATQVVLPAMRARRRGHIVNVASLAGLIGVFGYTDYAAAKFAVVGFSEALRSEVRRDDIGVSVLCPPDVDTPALAAENATKPRETLAVSAGASVLSADAVADALLAGVARRRFLIIPGREARFAHLARRLLPRLVDWVMDRQVARAQKAVRAQMR
jgi:short-subunit dehydrogenase